MLESLYEKMIDVAAIGPKAYHCFQAFFLNINQNHKRLDATNWEVFILFRTVVIHNFFTVLLFLPELVLAVLIFPTELVVLTILIFLTILGLTVLVYFLPNSFLLLAYFSSSNQSTRFIRAPRRRTSPGTGSWDGG